MSMTSPVYFSTLEIGNVRCFGGHQILDLTDNGQPARWSLLVGENGAGKTTLLECLAWMRPEPDVPSEARVAPGAIRPGTLDPLVHGMLQPALTEEEDEVLETLPRDSSQEVTIRANLSFGEFPSWLGNRPEDVPNSPKAIRVGMKLSFDAHALLRDLKPKRSQIKKLKSAFDEPLIVTYGANRYIGDANSLGGDGLGQLDHMRLSRRTELYNIETILMGLDYAARTDNPEPERSRLGLLKKAISRILPEEQDDDRIEIHPPDVLDTGRLSGVYVKTFTGLIPMSALSMGYRTTAGWVMGPCLAPIESLPGQS